MTKIRSLTEIDDLVAAGTLVALDVDETLVRSKDYEGSEEWYDALLATFESQGLSRLEATEKAYLLWCEHHRHADVVLVESHCPRQLRTWTERGAHLIGLTARAGDLATRTVQQLDLCGIGFAEPFTDVQPFAYSSRVAGLFLSGPAGDKGLALAEIVQRLPVRPNHVVFVDDREENILSVQREVLALTHSLSTVLFERRPR